jgi:hypothetical protein
LDTEIVAAKKEDNIGNEFVGVFFCFFFVCFFGWLAG